MNYHFHSNQYDAACEMVIRHHYSKRLPSNVQFVGSLHLDGGLFGDFGEMVAAIFFSIPPTRWSESGILELSRLVRGNDSVPLTKLISKSMKELRKSGWDLVVSFADNTQGHFGGVYQAASWQFAGFREPRMDGVIVDGTFIPGRSANSKWGTRSPIKLADMGIDAEPHFDCGKYLYFKALTRNGTKKAEALGLEHLPYPKPSANRL